MLPAEKQQYLDVPFELIARPDWVSHKPKPKADPDAGSSPQSYLLLDYQTLVDATGNHSYQRMCFQINDASCIEDMSQFLYTVKPDSQSVSFHRCVIYRDDQTIDSLDADNIRCMQRELQLERHVSSDALTIEFIIDDLRTGDIVDIETTYHSVKSAHPIHGHYIREGRHLAWSRPVAWQTIRVVNDSDTNLVVQHVDSAKDTNDQTVVSQGAVFEEEWKDLPRTYETGNLPAEYWPPYLFIATDSRWSEISAYMHHFYHKAGVFEAVNTAELELGNTTEESLINNIRFVQNNIRYRSDSNGIFTHTPKLPSKTLKKRTGDCKDKSTLLLSVLNAMGIEANLALVDTGLRDAIKTVTPSPLLFNHMIVHFKWQEKSYFVDATIQKQGGTLATMANLPYKTALILKPEGGELVDIPYPTDSWVYKLIQRFDLSLTEHSKPSVTYRREYFGTRADNMRQYFSADELTSIQKSYREGLSEQLEAELTPLKEMHIVTDDMHSNHLITEESYLIETPLDEIDDGYLILTTPFYQQLEISNTAATPEELSHDGESQQEIYITHATKPTGEDDSFQCDNQWFNYTESSQVEGNTVQLKVSLKPKSSTVTADQRKEYIQQVDILRNRCNTRFQSVVEDTTQLGIEFFAIAAAILAAMCAIADVIPGPAGMYLVGVYGLYKLYTSFAKPK